MASPISTASPGAGWALAFLQALLSKLGQPTSCFSSAKAGEELGVTGVVGSSVPWMLLSSPFAQLIDMLFDSVTHTLASHLCAALMFLWRR